MTNYALFNGTGVQDLFVYGNLVTQDSFGYMIVFGVYLVSFVSLKNFYTTPRCMVTSAYIGNVLCVLLYAAGVITDRFLLVSIVLLIISSLYLFFVGVE